jgi:hypothetical protein
MCSLQEAFQSMMDTAAPAVDGMPRRKKKRTVLPPPEPLVVDPDRPSFKRVAASAGELLGGPPPTQSAMLNAYDYDTSAASYFPNPSNDVDTKDAFLLEPDWTRVFHDTSAPDWIKARLPNRESEVPLEPAAWLDGAATLWANVPAPVTKAAPAGAGAGADRIDAMQQRIDSMFKKLEDMEVTRSESNLLEILLFVLGGVFLLLLVDMMVKQGMRATLMLAGSGGGTAALTQLIGGGKI